MQMKPHFAWRALVGNAVFIILFFVFHRFTTDPQREWLSLHQRQIHHTDSTLAMAAVTPTIMLQQTIRYGETLAGLLQDCAVLPGDIVRAVSALQKTFDPRDLRAGYSIQVAVDSAGALHELLYHPSPEIAVRVERTADGELTSRCDTLALTPEVFLLTGEVESTIYGAVLERGERPELLMNFTDILQWDVDFLYDTQRGDRFRILFEKMFVITPDGQREFVRYGRILGASYEPVQLPPEKFFTAFYFKPENGKDGYFDRDGKSFQKTFLKSPLSYRRISSTFSSGRRHPILNKVRAHTGVDFAAAVGTPVMASANGTVLEVGWKGGYGNCVVIAHKNHYTTLYGHLSRFAESLKAGDNVAQSEVIGYVGSTGLSSGPHLHYTMFLNGQPINPLRMQPSSGDPIPAELMPRFIEQRQALMQQMGLLTVRIPFALRD